MSLFQKHSDQANQVKSAVIEIGSFLMNILLIMFQKIFSDFCKSTSNFFSGYLAKIVADQGHSFTTCSELQCLCDAMAKLCFVSPHADYELNNTVNDQELRRTYELPDGGKLILESERFRCPELFFNPKLCGVDSFGIQHCVLKSCLRSNVDIQRDLFRNVILSGRSTSFPGFGDRLQKEVASLVADEYTVKVISPPYRQYAAWIGGSILGSFSEFDEMCIAKEDYLEFGPRIINIKCF